MSAEEIVRGLREMLPPKVDYAKLVCAEGFAHGQCYVWEDLEPYIISEAAALIESLQAQLAASQQETRALLDDIAHDMACGICAHCSVSLVNEPCASCRGNSSKFEWSGTQADKGEYRL